MAATIKISQLPAAASALSGDQLETNQGGTTRRITLEQVKTLMLSDGTWLPITGGTLFGQLNVYTLVNDINKPAVNITQEWDNVATTFTAFTVNAIDTASNASSLLAHFLLGGATRFSISKTGAIYAAGGATLSNALVGTSAQFGGGASGSVSLSAGDATHSGYIGFNRPGGVRLGFIGFYDNRLSYNADAGFLHEFNGDVVINGALTANSVRSSLFNATGNQYQLNGRTAIAEGPAGFTALYNVGDGAPNIHLGGTGDQTSYYRNNKHIFGNVGGGTTYLDMQASGAGFSGAVTPIVDNTKPLGGASNRWSVVYAGTGAINTSGRDEKAEISDPSDAERKAAARIKAIGPKRYKYRDAVAAKGDAARWHFGFIAEDVRDALAAEGLDPWSYGMLCADPVMETDPEDDAPRGPGQQERRDPRALLDDAGNPVMRLGLRYDELSAFLLAAV